MIGIDLFAGAGGMTLGARRAGIDVQFAVEMNFAAATTYRYNHPKVDLIQDDITRVNQIGLIKPNAEVVLFGGPPCQGFSTSNQRTRNKDNIRNWLFEHFIRFVQMVQPDWVIFENVAGILQTMEGIFAKELLSRLANLGYSTSHGLLNSADFGCPQRRTRYFVLGSRNHRNIDLPSITKIDKVFVKDAISDLPLLENGASTDILPYRMPATFDYAKCMRGALEECSGNLVSRNADEIIDRYDHIPQGGNWRNIPGMMRQDRNDYRRYHNGIYRRLNEEDLSIVIGNYRKSMIIHPTQNRGLSIREAARLQSFPDHYKFFGSIGLQQQQVGNAVPPLLAEAVFAKVKEISLAEKATQRLCA